MRFLTLVHAKYNIQLSSNGYKKELISSAFRKGLQELTAKTNEGIIAEITTNLHRLVKEHDLLTVIEVCQNATLPNNREVVAKYEFFKKIKDNWKDIVKKSLLSLIAGLIAHQSFSGVAMSTGLEKIAKQQGVEMKVKYDTDHKEFEFSTKDGGKMKLSYDEAKPDAKVIKESKDQKMEKFVDAWSEAIEKVKVDKEMNPEEPKSEDDYGTKYGSDLSPKKAKHLQSLEKEIIDSIKDLDAVKDVKELEKKIDHLLKVNTKINNADYGGTLNHQKLKIVQEKVKTYDDDKEDKPTKDKEVKTPATATEVIKDKILTSANDSEKYDTYIEVYKDHPDLETLEKKLVETLKRISQSEFSEKSKKLQTFNLQVQMLNMLDTKTGYDPDVQEDTKEVFTSPDKALDNLDVLNESLDKLDQFDYATFLDDVDEFKKTSEAERTEKLDGSGKNKIVDWNGNWWDTDKTAGDLYNMQMELRVFLDAPDFNDLDPEDQKELLEAEDLLQEAAMDMRVGGKRMSGKDVKKQVG